VIIDGVACGNLTRVDSDTLTCTTPLHDAGSVNLVVVNPDGQMDTAPFTFDPPSAPTLSSITPQSGPISGGTVVTISGAKLASGALVYFDNVAATNVTVVSSTQITATTPAHAAGPVDVAVSNGVGLNTTLAQAFTYLATTSDQPVVSLITPNSGPTEGGTSVAILGNHLTNVDQVKIGVNAATNVMVINDTTLVATTGPGTAGAADVVVTNTSGQSGTLAKGFTYGSSSSALALLAVVPNEGDLAGGQTVKLVGANFADGISVTFGGVAATGVSVIDSNQLTLKTPAHAAGAVDVVAESSDGQSVTLTGGFTYTTTTISSGGGGCSCDVNARSSSGGWLTLLLIAALLVRRYSSSSTSSVFQYDASTRPKNGSHSR